MKLFSIAVCPLLISTLLLQSHAGAADLMITKDMAEKCAEFKGQKEKYRDCLVRQGAQVKKPINKTLVAKGITSNTPCDGGIFCHANFLIEPK